MSAQRRRLSWKKLICRLSERWNRFIFADEISFCCQNRYRRDDIFAGLPRCRIFERDGEKWVAFKLKNRKTGEEHVFEKKVERSFKVKRAGKDESRKAIKMDVKMGGEVFSAVFSIADRSNFDYQGLVGRNILTGRFLVDTSTSYTLN